MSQPSVRKQKKQKDREWRVAKKKQEALEQRVYARKFPAYEIQANNADHGFVQFIERSLRDIDFRDGTMFHPKETEFLKHVKREPGEVIPALHRGIADHNLSAMYLASMVGHRVFTRIGPARLRQWIPFHDVQFLLAGEKIIVRFRSLERAKGNRLLLPAPAHGGDQRPEVDRRLVPPRHRADLRAAGLPLGQLPRPRRRVRPLLRLSPLRAVRVARRALGRVHAVRHQRYRVFQRPNRRAGSRTTGAEARLLPGRVLHGGGRRELRQGDDPSVPRFLRHAEVRADHTVGLGRGGKAQAAGHRQRHVTGRA